jgi:DNA-binding SARP family transcriptional activator
MTEIHPRGERMSSALLADDYPIPAEATAQALGQIEISLLGAFSISIDGTRVERLSVGSQRLLAFLALQGRTVTRAAMAGRMWPEASDEHAGVSLRSALSRLDAAVRGAVVTSSAGLRLAESVGVDLHDAQSLATRVLRPGSSDVVGDLSPEATTLLAGELLPDWYDDSVLAAAEDWRQLRLSALEAQAMALRAQDRLAEAAGAARAAINVDPLRESAHVSLIRVHLADGNQSEAIRVYERYAALLQSGLGIPPTIRMTELVADIHHYG